CTFKRWSLPPPLFSSSIAYRTARSEFSEPSTGTRMSPAMDLFLPLGALRGQIAPLGEVLGGGQVDEPAPRAARENHAADDDRQQRAEEAAPELDVMQRVFHPRRKGLAARLRCGLEPGHRADLEPRLEIARAVLVAEQGPVGHQHLAGDEAQER